MPLVAGPAVTERRPERAEDAPTALVYRFTAGAALNQRAPIDFLKIDVHADLLQQVGCHQAHRMNGGEVRRIDDDDFLARVSSLLQSLARGVEVARHGIGLVGFVRGITGKHRRAGAPQAVIVAERGAHVILLLDAEADRATDAGVVERRLEGVEADQGYRPWDCRWRQ